MVRSRRGKGKKHKSLLGNHQRCWIWGRHAVLETLEAGRWPVIELYLDEAMGGAALAEADALASRSETPLNIAPAKRLFDLCHTTEHQGYLAKMAEYPYAAEADILTRVNDASLFVLLDGIQDPYNFGAIVRTAEVMGASAVLIGAKRQAPVSSMVARSSAGAVNRIDIARVEDWKSFIDKLKAKKISVIGLDANGEKDLTECDLKGAVCLAIGNEGRGLSGEVSDSCNTQARIPQYGAIGSLNAAASAAIAIYEVQRQRSVLREVKQGL